VYGTEADAVVGIGLLVVLQAAGCSCHPCTVRVCGPVLEVMRVVGARLMHRFQIDTDSQSVHDQYPCMYGRSGLIPALTQYRNSTFLLLLWR